MTGKMISNKSSPKIPGYFIYRTKYEGDIVKKVALVIGLRLRNIKSLSSMM